MSKSKEQSITIISQKLDSIEETSTSLELMEAFEETIVAIATSEAGILWAYDNSSQVLTNVKSQTQINMSVGESIVKTVLLSKKAFFDNHVATHKHYNQSIDNPLSLQIKSLLVVPIVDKSKKNIVGFILAFNGTEEFKRYDLRSLSLLNSYALSIYNLAHTSNNHRSIETHTSEKIIKQELVDVEKTVPLADSNENVVSEATLELKEELKAQSEKIRRLENELFLKEEELKRIDNEVLSLEGVFLPDVLEDDSIKPEEIKIILDFLTNEMTYLSSEEHKVYLFLEIIKNSLHNKEQLRFIDRALDKSQLINQLANDLYVREKMPIIVEEFNPYQVVYSLCNLYSIGLSNNNVVFNIFIDPLLPNILISDVDKIKSLMVHLMNNIQGFVTQNGVIDLSVDFSKEKEELSIQIKGCLFQEQKGIKNFFHNENMVTSHSLITSDTGLGLSVSSNLVHILGGKLKLETTGNDEHSFMVSLPIKTVEHSTKKDFFHKTNIKIGILMSEENRHAYTNLERYLNGFNFDHSNILVFTNYKKISNVKLTHLICFENMLSKEFDMRRFPSVITLKYSNSEVLTKYTHNIEMNELYINSYYGMNLQKILFPTMEIEEFTKGTLLAEDTFLSKLSNVVKKLKLA